MTTAKTMVTDVVPASMLGFAVDVRFGPYPIDAPRTHRRAVYAVLTPTDPGCCRLMRQAGKTRIMSCVPLTLEAAAAVVAGDDDLIEEVSLRALAATVSRARRVWEAR